MRHRHLIQHDWSLVAIDSVIEHGDLPDWQELFARARQDREIADRVRQIARAHAFTGPFALASALVDQFAPEPTSA